MVRVEFQLNSEHLKIVDRQTCFGIFAFCIFFSEDCACTGPYLEALRVLLAEAWLTVYRRRGVIDALEGVKLEQSHGRSRVKLLYLCFQKV